MTTKTILTEQQQTTLANGLRELLDIVQHADSIAIPKEDDLVNESPDDHTQAVSLIINFAKAIDAGLAGKTLSAQSNRQYLEGTISVLYGALTGKSPESGMLDAIIRELP